MLGDMGNERAVRILLDCILVMNKFKSMYNSPFEDAHSHPIHICFPIIASDVLDNLTLFEDDAKFMWRDSGAKFSPIGRQTFSGR